MAQETPVDAIACSQAASIEIKSASISVRRHSMSRLPRKCSGMDLVKILTKVGFRFFNIKGSHYVMMNNTRRGPIILSIPLHKPLTLGTLLRTVKRAGLTREKFLMFYTGKTEMEREDSC